MEIRKLNHDETLKALNLVWDTFLKFEAPDYSEEGIKTFNDCINDPSFIGALEFYAAFEHGKIVGVLATRSNGSHIALFFVDGKYHRKGIGRKLFEVVSKKNQSNKMTVNSSPYAVEIYQRLGFINTSTEQVMNGMRYIPMVFTKEIK